MMKKFLKTLLVCIISIIVIYSIFTLKKLFDVCEKYQIDLISNTQRLDQLDKGKIQQLADEMRNFETVMKEAALEDDETIGDYFDPLGFAIWNRIQIEAYSITHEAIDISIILGVTTAIAYATITSKKLSRVFKFIIGYFAIIVIVPPLYMFSYTYSFWETKVMYFNSKNITFYICYTIIFVLICVINYIISKKMTKDLNNAMKEDKI